MELTGKRVPMGKTVPMAQMVEMEQTGLTESMAKMAIRGQQD